MVRVGCVRAGKDTRAGGVVLVLPGRNGKGEGVATGVLAGALAVVAALAVADVRGDDENPWKPTSERLGDLVKDGFVIIDTNVLVPPSGSGVTVEVIYLRQAEEVFRCLTRHVEGSEGARHRCDRLRR